MIGNAASTANKEWPHDTVFANPLASTYHHQQAVTKQSLSHAGRNDAPAATLHIDARRGKGSKGRPSLCQVDYRRARIANHLPRMVSCCDHCATTKELQHNMRRGSQVGCCSLCFLCFLGWLLSNLHGRLLDNSLGCLLDNLLLARTSCMIGPRHDMADHTCRPKAELLDMWTNEMPARDLMPAAYRWRHSNVLAMKCHDQVPHCKGHSTHNTKPTTVAHNGPSRTRPQPRRRLAQTANLVTARQEMCPHEGESGQCRASRSFCDSSWT